MSRRDWKKELGWSDTHIEDIRNFAFAYVRQGKYDIAIPFFDALIVLDPQNSYDAQMLGALYVQTNQPEKAIFYLNRALTIEGNHGPTLLNLMKAFFMSGKKKDGLRLAQLLQKDSDPYISGTASALILCYS